MVNVDLHKNIFIRILREIYADPLLRTSLGFKGGTAALLFFGLPRFSVDLDFDLLRPENKSVVYAKLKAILPEFGELSEAIEKHYTLFFLIRYKKSERNLKVEVSKRPLKAEFVKKNYLGIPMLVMSRSYMAAGKLAALLTRKKFASRDLFDLWYFLKNNWQIDQSFLKAESGYSLTEAINKAETLVKKLKKTELLSGLGELLESNQKIWVKKNLTDELLFLLRLYKKHPIT